MTVPIIFTDEKTENSTKLQFSIFTNHENRVRLGTTHLMKIFAYLFIVLVIFIMLSATFQWENPIMGLIKGFKYGDKFAHLILIGILAYCINYLLKFKTIKRFNQNLLVGTIAITVFITLEELSQIWISTRTFDLMDLSANYVGIAIATLIIVKTKPEVV